MIEGRAAAIGRAHDVAVVGGGIVGLAIADALLGQAPGLDVVVLEKERGIAAHQTGHNSGVVHSGLYYRPGSAKARTCTAGGDLLRAFCDEHGVPLREVGKVVVATGEDELPRLAELERRGSANGVPGLRRIGPDELREIEPHAAGIAALHVPHAAIVDYSRVAAALAARIVARGGEVRTGAAVRAFRDEPGALRLATEGGDVHARAVVTAAGLQSDRVARAATGVEPGARIVPFRGEYHTLAAEREQLVRGLIYPVPDPRFPFLGVHFTRRIDGGVECGPNAVLALRREGYARASFSLRDTASTFGWPGFWRLAGRHARTGIGEMWRSLSTAAFARALARLVPGLVPADLRRGGCGVRAQALRRDGGLVDDFLLLDGERAIHVVNAPSPAATASLAIGAEAAHRS